MKLYYFETTNPRKVCAVAKYLDLPVEYVRVDLAQGEQKQSEYLAINPNGKVPALIDGDISLFESTAIMMHLAQRAESQLWPNARQQQVEALQWLAWDIAHFSRHASTVYFEHFIKNNFGFGEPDAAAVDEAVGFFRTFAAVLNSHLTGRSFLVGGNLTIADFGVASVISVARELQLTELPVAEFGEVSRWIDTLMDFPAWRDPWPQK